MADIKSNVRSRGRTSICHLGYEVRPAQNGGFIVVSIGSDRSPYSDPHIIQNFFAFSNSDDLLQFLVLEHSRNSTPNVTLAEDGA